MDAKFAGRDEFAESTAHILLENADLPLLIRARALIVLGCSQKADCLEMAEEAIRIVRVGMAEMESNGAPPNEEINDLLRECEKVRDGAKEFLDEYGDALDELDTGEAKQEQQTEEQKQEAMPEAEGELKKGQKASRNATDPDKTTRVGDSPPKMGRRSRQTKNAAGEDAAAAKDEGEGEGETGPGEDKTDRK